MPANSFVSEILSFLWINFEKMVALAAAVFAFLSARASQKSASANEKVLKAQTAPYVNVYIAPREDQPQMAVYIIENTGYSSAYNVIFRTGSCFGIITHDGKNDGTLPEKHPFNYGISTMPPRYRLVYNIDLWKNLDNREFTISWSYSDQQGNRYNASFRWSDLKNSAMAVGDPPLTIIANEMKKISNTMAVNECKCIYKKHISE